MVIFVSVLLFAAKTSNVETLVAAATYSAVLVVFVGTNSSTLPSPHNLFDSDSSSLNHLRLQPLEPRFILDGLRFRELVSQVLRSNKSAFISWCDAYARLRCTLAAK
jgi:hypothetical protein